MKKHDQTPILAYAITIFLSAFLLFQVQPMMGKMVLPWFGGAASVWTACMLFFQSLLLLLSLEAAFNVAKAGDVLAQKNRNLDYGVSVYATDTPAYTSVYNSSGTESLTNYARGVSYGFLVSVPIPISQLYDADLVAAKNARLQAEIMLEDAKNRVYFEVNQALLQFNGAKTKLQTALDNQKNLADKKMANLDDVNNWHAAEVEAIDAKVNYAKALLFLGRVSGLKSVLAM